MRWRNGGRRSSSIGYSCKEVFAFVSQKWGVQQQPIVKWFHRGPIFSTTSRKKPLNRKEFCIAKQKIMKNVLIISWTHAFLNPSTKNMKLCISSNGFIFYFILLGDFFSTSELLYLNMKLRPQLIRARHTYTWLVTTPTFVLELLIVLFTLVVLLSKITKQKDWTCFHILL